MEDSSDDEDNISVTSSNAEDDDEEEIIEEGDVEVDRDEILEEEDDEESDTDSIDSNMDGGDADDVEEGDNNEEIEQKTKRVKKVPSKTIYKKPEFVENEDDDENDEDGELYLQKFDQSINENYIVNFHPESVLQNYEEILTMVKVIRDKDGIIIDDLHKTIPFLTKYERARILGQRAKQINSGATPFVKVSENVIDGYIIAELELKEKKIPFIIRRPLPNGGSEYWSLIDLEDITF
jgi:DNA-directed RNA polymerase subunit K/omega